MYGYWDDLLKYFKFDKVKIDNNVFRLHYKLTVMVFACAGILVSSGQYIGDPIDCIAEGVPGGIMDTYCWIHSTFSIPSRWVGKQGIDHPHPGIAPIADLEDNTEIKYHVVPMGWIFLRLASTLLLHSASLVESVGEWKNFHVDWRLEGTNAQPTEERRVH
jgi:hypothetical protein